VLGVRLAQLSVDLNEGEITLGCKAYKRVRSR
jgi:hypothetical protein